MAKSKGRLATATVYEEGCVTPERWRRLQDLFEAAALLPNAEQQAYLKAHCADDMSLVDEVSAMLAIEQDDFQGDTDLSALAEQAFDQEDDPYLSRTFGPYLFKSRLAVGGMSWVYLAERSDYGGIVAVKVLRDQMDTPRRQLFDYEMRLLAQMKHQHIAQLYDAGALDDGAAFFAMEFVDGVRITEYCQQHRLDLKARLALFHQVCDAVRYAHARTIVHRDLKPSNILIQGDGRAKLLDFGVSGQAGSAGETAPSSSYMTLAYAAPEQIRREPSEVQADVYSLGVVLQQLITGRLPFDLEGKTTDEVRSVVLNELPLVPSAAIRFPAGTGSDSESSAIALTELSRIDWADIDHICAKALAKDPAARYSSVESLARDLRRFEQRRPLEDFRPGRGYVLSRYLQRNHRAVLFAVALLTCIAGLIGFYTYRLARARDTALAEAAKADRVEKFMEQLITGGDPNNGPSLDLRVVSVLEQGVRQVQTLDTDPPIQARLYQLLGGIYGNLNDFAIANHLFTVALNKQSDIFGPSSIQAADTLADWGYMHLNEGKPEQAESMMRRAIAIDDRLLPETNSQAVQAHIALGVILTHRGAYADAVTVLEKAMANASGKDASPYDLSAAMSNLADAEQYRGKLDRAGELLNQSIKIDRQLKGDKNHDIAQDLLSIASLDESLGRLAKAEDEERRALTIEQHWYQGKDYPDVAAAMTILAQTLVKEGHPEEALSLAENSLAMRQRLHAPPSLSFAHAWNALGQIHMKLKDLDAAEKDHTASLVMYRKVLPASDYRVGVCLDNLAAIQLERRKYTKAEELDRQALDLFTSQLPADDGHIGRTEAHYGRALQGEHKLGEAEKLYLAAYAIFKAHQEVYEPDLKAVKQLLMQLYLEEQKPQQARQFAF